MPTLTPSKATPRTPAVALPHGTGRVATAQERAGALEFLQALAGEVSGGSVNLPCFPDVVLRVRKALEDPDAQLTQTVQIVGAEPRLAARLLQTANSAVFNAGGKPVTELRGAITRLGTRLVQSSTMAFAVQQMRLAPVLRSISKPLKAVWEESIAVASICELVSRRTNVVPEEAFLTGLLHGIGRLYIMVRAASSGEKYRNNRSLLEMIDGWHPAIGKAVLENWGFSPALAEAVGNQQDYEYGARIPDRTDVLVVGVVLAAALRAGGALDTEIEDIKSFRRLSLTPPECRSVLKHTAHHLGALRAALGC